MVTINASVETDLAPGEVLSRLTDFGPTRSDAWPGVDSGTFTVHDRGANWADVTEGNKLGWERERYGWDALAGTVEAVTTDSNLWGPGSRWDYRVVPSGHGSRVEVTLTRFPKTFKGRLVALLIPLVGRRTVARSVGAAVKAS